MHKINVFIKERGLWIETELLSMAMLGDRCIVLAQDRVAIAWLVYEEGAFKWVVFDNGLDLYDDPRSYDEDADLPEIAHIEHSHCVRCTHDGSCQFQTKM